MAGLPFNPDRDIPNLAGKVILVTGGTAGLGRESVIALAKHRPEHIYFSGRDAGRAAGLISEVAAVPYTSITFIQCDLASLSSVNEAAKKITTHTTRLDIVICNAGVMAQPPGLTADGYEVHFGTNHVGHALLLKLLLPTLLRTAAAAADPATADVRIINLTSEGFRFHPKGCVAFAGLRMPQGGFGAAGAWRCYSQSKVANILYAAELARRYPSITTVSVHPGVVSTDLVGNLSLLNKALVYVTNIGKVKPPAEGAWNQLWAATADKASLVGGAYYVPVAVRGKHTKESDSVEIAAKLWEWTEKELKPYPA